MRTMISLSVAALLAFTGCTVTVNGLGPVVRGSGVTKEEQREVPAFTGVDVAASFEATVTIGDKQSVTLQVDDNLLPLVKTEVKDGHLVVNYAQGNSIQSSQPQKVIIVVPSLDYVAARGASKVTATAAESKGFQVVAHGASTVKVSGLATDQIEVEGTGASHATLIGKSKQATIKLSGASTIMAGEATFESAKVKLSGASSGEVLVNSSIEGDLSGASSLKVKGDPKTRTVKTSGASSVSY